MPSANLVKLLAMNGVALGLGALVAVSCVGVEYPAVAFRCNPRQSDACPEDYTCCSDDPARLRGEALFSGFRNGSSAVGMCVQKGSVPAGSGQAELPGCPIPCNPEWDAGTVTSVCGAGRSCCQTVEITANDCVADGGTFRPATGGDVFASPRLSSWGVSEHDTHQDPNGKICLEIGRQENPNEPESSTAFVECVRALGVANVRGFCLSLDPGVFCPTANPAYLDACEQLNMGLPPG